MKISARKSRSLRVQYLHLRARFRSGILERALQIGAGPIARGAAIASVWQVVRLGCNAATVIVVARLVGPDGYGMLAGLAGGAIILGGLIGSGGGFSLLQAVSASPSEFPRHWWASLRLIGVSAALFIGLYIALARPLLDVATPLPTLTFIALAELLLYPLAYAGSFAFQAHQRIGLAAAIPALMAFARLAGSCAFAIFAETRDIETYATYYFSAALAGCILSVGGSVLLLKPRYSAAWYSSRELRDCGRFSVAWFGTATFGEIDKLTAVRLAGVDLAGVYSAAYRLITLLAVPVTSLAYAVQPQLFRLSQTGSRREITKTISVVSLTACAYGCLASLAVGLAAPLVPLLLGADFKDGERTAKLLAPLLFVMCMRTTAGTFLTSLGRPGLRAASELTAAVFLVVLSTALMPKYGLTGIAATVVVSEFVLLVVLALLVFQVVRSIGGNPLNR